MLETKKGWRFFIVALILLLLIIALGLLLNPLFTGGSIQENRSPSTCSGAWSSCANAFTDDSSRATASVNDQNKKSGIWRNYNLLIPQSATIEKVYLRADFFAKFNNGYLDIKISNDGGLTYGPSHIIGGNTQEKDYLIDVTNDRTWSPSSLNNEKLIVQATCFKKGGGKNPLCYLDWLPVNASYTLFDFSLSISPSGNSVSPGGATSALIFINSLGGISQPVSLSQTGCPPATSCILSPLTGNPPYNSQLLITTSPTTPTGKYLITIISSGDGKTKSTGFILNVTSSTNETQNISSPPPTSNMTSNNSCFDSDGGLNYNVPGNVTKGSSTYKDYCGNQQYNYTIEYYCASSESVAEQLYSCPKGQCSWDVTGSGACSDDTAPCTDSDGGLNYNVKGSVTNSLLTHTDYCGNPSLVVENYCDANSKMVYSTYSCTCSDGACV